MGTISPEKSKFRAWITKYALTQGVYEEEVRAVLDCPDMVTDDKTWPSYFHGEGRNWCRTREAALEVAEAMRKKRIAALKKQITKLEKMNFL